MRLQAASGDLIDRATAIVAAGHGALMQVEAFLQSFLRPWNAYQVLIVLAAMVAAYLAAQWLGPQLHAWMRSREGWPRWRMRILVVVHKRLRMIAFVALIWAIAWILRAATWPSRSYLIALVANLALAWLIVTMATRLIANPFLRVLVRYGAWIWVTLRILDLTTEAETLLDRFAVSVGDMRLSAWTVLQALFVLTLLFYAARFIARTVTERIQRSEDMSPSMQVLVVKMLQVALYGTAFFVALKAVGVDLTGLAVLSGAIGVGLGFGLQKVVSNLVSGVIILLDKSIKPGDVISLGDTFGWIASLGARYVSVVTRDGKEYLIPNEDLITGQVVNWSHSNEFVRLDVYFGTSYGSDPHLVRRLAIEAAQRRGPGAEGPRAGLPHRGLRRLVGGLHPAVLDLRPDRGADQHPRQRVPRALGRVQGQRHRHPVPAARGAGAGGQHAADTGGRGGVITRVCHGPRPGGELPCAHRAEERR